MISRLVFTDGATWRLLIQHESTANRNPLHTCGNGLLSLGGSKGFLRGGRKCMNRMPRKLASLPVSRVYLVERAGSQSQ